MGILVPLAGVGEFITLMGALILALPTLLNKLLSALLNLIFDNLLKSVEMPLLQLLTGEGDFGHTIATGSGHSLFELAAPVGIALLVPFAIARIAMALMDPKRPAAATIFTEVLPRAVFITLFLAPPAYLGEDLISFAINASDKLGNALFSTFFYSGGAVPGSTGSTAGDLANQISYWRQSITTSSGLAGLIGVVIMACFLVWDAFLMVIRAITLAFAVALAPLVAAAFMFSGRNRVVNFWLDLFLGSLYTPVVMGTIFAISFTASNAVKSAPGLGPLYSVITLAIGMWFAGHSVRALMKGHMGAHSFSSMYRSSLQTLALGPSALRTAKGLVGKGAGAVHSATSGGAGVATAAASFVAGAAGRASRGSGLGGAGGGSGGGAMSMPVLSRELEGMRDRYYMDDAAGVQVLADATPQMKNLSASERMVRLKSDPQNRKLYDKLNQGFYAAYASGGLKHLEPTASGKG